MKQHQNFLLSITITTLTVAILGLTTVPAFATSSVSFPPWNTLQEIPSYTAGACNTSSNACADARSTAVNDLFSKSNPFTWYSAYARNNMQKSPNIQGSSPQLTSSVSTIKYKVDVTYSGSQTITAGQLAYYEFGSDLMKQSGSSWNKVSGCYKAIGGSGLKSASEQKVCTYTNSGTSTFQSGAQHKADTPAYLIGAQNVIDYWTGSYHADTTRLEICDNC